jgi:hypothetical protein
MKTTKAALKEQLAAEIARGQAAIDALAVIENRARTTSSTDSVAAAALFAIATLAAKGLGR